MTGMRSVGIVEVGFPEEVGRNVDAREDDTDELFVGDCAPMIRIHHAEHGSSLGGPYVFHARPLRHVLQKACELLLVESTRAVFVDFEKLLVLTRGESGDECGSRHIRSMWGSKGVSLQVLVAWLVVIRVGPDGTAHQAVGHQPLLKQFGL